MILEKFSAQNNLPLLYREVLNSILNPNLPLGEAVYDPEEDLHDAGIEVEEDSKEILDTEKQAVQAAHETRDEGHSGGACGLCTSFTTRDPAGSGSAGARRSGGG